MRALFGVVSLLLALAVVGVVATKQLRAVNPSASAPSADDNSAAAVQPAANVREQSQQMQQRAKDDVTRALQQGAARSEEPSQ
ncbi:hypothetical protein [Piscinibacter sp.]|uniref:hypothetical protein n=1 Tax=Piscinibacter sp. TaxID=1903157 RepID=UPI002C76577B|nr:hypothetical protein [Albitalea sp.]HUG21395.1 hypothetical protein [Albitalea sp.]